MPNDMVSSVKVFGHDQCCLVVYEHEFSGWSGEFTPGDYPHDKFLEGGARNDKVTSLEVLNTGCPNHNS